MSAPGLTENHERSLLASLSYASKLIRDSEALLASADRPDPFARYSGTLTPPQIRIMSDYLRRLHAQLLRITDALGLAPPAPSVDRHHALTTALLFLDNTFEEMRGRYLRDARIETSVLVSKADLLAPEDLERVLAYLARTLQERLGAEVPVRAVSTAATHVSLLRAWIDHDIGPLDREVRQRRATAQARRMETLRVKAMQALEHELASGTAAPVPPPSPPSDDGAARLRDVRARIEQLRREAAALPARRDALVDAALNRAAASLVSVESGADAVRALARPSVELGERMSQQLGTLASEAQQAVTTRHAALGFPAATIDELALDREMPVADIPTLADPPSTPPLWARLSPGLRHRWIRGWLDEAWTPLVSAAIAAHLAVLAHWVRERLDQLGREVDGYSQLVPEARARTLRSFAKASRVASATPR